MRCSVPIKRVDGAVLLRFHSTVPYYWRQRTAQSSAPMTRGHRTEFASERRGAGRIAGVGQDLGRGIKGADPLGPLVACGLVRLGIVARRLRRAVAATGKTHLAIALGLAACRLGRRVRFFTAANLVTRLEEAQKAYQLDRFLAQLDKADLLICDELGYLSFGRSGSTLHDDY